MKLRMSWIDRWIESIARSTRAAASSGSLAHQLRDVLERQADRIHVLDDPVVEVLGDPVAFVDDRETLELLVEPRVLHGDPGVQGEGLDERLVLRGEFGRADLVGEVEPPERDALDGDRDAQEAGHRRMIGREPGAAWVGADVVDPERSVLADDQAEETVASGRGPIRSRVAWSIPLVMNFSIRPDESTIPRAA